jgi:flagellar biosynthesis/type III secretory pathway ATPase
MGNTERGSITGLLTILLDADDPNDPVADTLRGLLDGHVYLDRNLAARGHYPAIDVLSSLSRLMPSLTSPEQQQIASLLRQDLALWRDAKDLVEVGAYRTGSNPALDAALERLPRHEAFLRQSRDETSTLDETLLALIRCFQPEPS